jgi:hypothetical protein
VCTPTLSGVEKKPRREGEGGMMAARLLFLVMALFMAAALAISACGTYFKVPYQV